MCVCILLVVGNAYMLERGELNTTNWKFQCKNWRGVKEDNQDNAQSLFWREK